MLDQNASTPLYEQLKQAIKDNIKNDIYKPGDRMPSEIELEQQYNVSRITVRRAVKELCEEKYLVKKQGKGTFVLAQDKFHRLDRSVGSFHDVFEEEGMKVTVKILEKSIVHVNTSYARDLQIDLDDDVIYLRRLMFADKKPIMLDSCYLPLKRFPGIEEKLDENISIFRMMEKEYGVSLERYYKVLKVRKATKEISTLLKCSEGEALFDLFKITYDSKGVPQSISISLLSGEDTFYVITNSESGEMNQNGMAWRM